MLLIRYRSTSAANAPQVFLSQRTAFQKFIKLRIRTEFFLVSHCLGGKLFAVELTGYFRKPVKLGLLLFVAFKNLNLYRPF